MYKALIADDEEIIRNGLCKFLSRDPHIDLVAQAEDGETALQLAREYLPDLLLVDINMPFLGGLEFIERLGEFLSGAVIIIISGYDDFAYVQKALELGALDYLLKPVMEETFYKTIERAKNKLEQDKKKVKYLEWARMQVEKNRPILIAALIEGWLSGSLSESEVIEQAGYLDVRLPECYGLTVARTFINERSGTVGQEWNENLLYFAAENIAREVFEAFEPVVSWKNTYGDLILIFSYNSESGWLESGRRASRLLEEYLPVNVMLEQGKACSIDELAKTYDAIIEKLEAYIIYTPLVSELKTYIERQYGNTELSLQSAAARYHVSTQHLSRLFRQEVGVTFVDYMTKVRIGKAVQLLLESEIKIYEIAERVGYASQHYFSRAFKRVLGVSPVEYRTCSRSSRKPT